MASLFNTSAGSLNWNTLAISDECRNSLGLSGGQLAGNFFVFFCMWVLCHATHYFLKPLSQPRITSDTVIGIIVGNIRPLRDKVDQSFVQTLNFITDFGMMLYMFVLGLEMDYTILFRPPTKEAKVAYAGMLTTLILAGVTVPFLRISGFLGIGATTAICITLSGTASPVLTRLLTSRRIGKSDIGRLVIAAGMHSDFIFSLLMSFGYAVFPVVKTSQQKDQVHPKEKWGPLPLLISLVFQILFTAKISPIFMTWVNNENPEGKPMKGSHLVLSIAFMALCCISSLFWGNSSILSAFVAGVFLPKEGRMSKWVINKVNYSLNMFFYPIFFFWMGLHADLRQFEGRHLMTWARLFILILVTTVGKVIGSVIAGAMFKFRWEESVSIGLLLNAKGHFHIYLAAVASNYDIISISSSIVFIIVAFFTIVHAPTVVSQIIKRARQRSPTHRLALQWLDPLTELRIMLCIHSPRNAQTSINFVEISKGRREPGMVVYVTDIIELTDRIAATIVEDDESDTLVVTDKSITELRDQVTFAFQTSAIANADGVNLERLLALSTFNNMARDLCALAEKSGVALIVLPFHKSQRSDGSLDEGHVGFRYVNRKVLKQAPCSVGILVDRGLGLMGGLTGANVSFNVAVIFIGGKDDREALAYASRVALYPAVKLSVLRFLEDTNAEPSRRATSYRITTREQEEEMKLDDEYFAQFYERYIAGGKVAYIEQHLANSTETLSTLRSLEGQYSLIIVGSGRGANSVLTVGMNDWEQCPELGPIGDVLSGTDFSMTTTVFIIQQPNPKGELDGLNDDFSIM